MIRSLILMIFGASLTASALAADFDPFEGPMPVAVMIKTNPWSMVIGSDTPSFVLYEDGSVIYLKQEPKQRPVYMATQLDPATMAAMLANLRTILEGPAPKPFLNLVPHKTDQSRRLFYVHVGDKYLVSMTYGWRSKANGSDSADKAAPVPNADELPQSLADLHQLMAKPDYGDAEPWVPKYVEAMVWSYDYAPEASIHWPDEWPGLDAPSTRQRGDSYSIFLPGSEKTRLLEFLATRNAKGAVEIDGKKWAVSVRNVFPSETTWSRVFRSAE